MIIGEQQEQ